MNVQRHQDIRNRKRKQRRTDAATHTQKFSEPFFFLSLLISASSSFFFFFSILTDLDSVVVSREEQKTAIIPPVDVGMENLPLPPFSSSLSNPSSSAVNDNSPSTESRLLESTNWYDDGSIATCIDQTSPQIPSRDLREISNEQILPQVNLSNAQDEFFLFSPRNTIDDEPSSSISDEKHESIESPSQTSKHLQPTEDDQATLTDEFYCSSTVDPFGYSSNYHTTTSNMITNLDDILIDEDEEEEEEQQHQSKDSSNFLLNTNYRRPIQEDILYEVEHENSFSDHSQNTSSVLLADDHVSSF